MQGSDIKKYIEANGIKQNYVAEKSGIPTSIFNMMLNNNRKIEVNEYMAICSSLELPLDYFANKPQN